MFAYKYTACMIIFDTQKHNHNTKFSSPIHVTTKILTRTIHKPSHLKDLFVYSTNINSIAYPLNFFLNYDKFSSNYKHLTYPFV